MVEPFKKEAQLLCHQRDLFSCLAVRRVMHLHGLQAGPGRDLEDLQVRRSWIRAADDKLVAVGRDLRLQAPGATMLPALSVKMRGGRHLRRAASL